MFHLFNHCNRSFYIMNSVITIYNSGRNIKMYKKLLSNNVIFYEIF